MLCREIRTDLTTGIGTHAVSGYIEPVTTVTLFLRKILIKFQLIMTWASLLHGCCFREGISLGQSLLKMTNWGKGTPACITCLLVWIVLRQVLVRRSPAHFGPWLYRSGSYVSYTPNAASPEPPPSTCSSSSSPSSQYLTSAAIYFERLSACCTAQFCSGFQPHHIT